MKIKILSLLFLSLFLFNCSSDSAEVPVEEEMGEIAEEEIEEEVEEEEIEEEEEVNETTINYTEDVQPILAGNCYNCHGESPTNGTSTSFFTYDEVVLFSDQISDRINARGNNNSMPPSGLLNASVIAVIDQWIVDGLLEN